MTNRPSMWGSSSSPSWKTGNVTTAVGNEIDLRVEFDRIVFGDEQHIPHGHWILIRRMRRESNGDAVYCTCMEGQTTREADPRCSYCGGEGYLWDEEWMKTYSMYGGADNGLLRRETYMAPGSIRADYKIFFLRYDSGIRYGDKVVEVALDIEGQIQIPYVREAIYKPQTINTYRSDYGRIEYFALYCREEDAIRSDNLGGN